MTDVRIASVTVARNGLGVLPGHLESLLRQNPGLREVIVVDNASTDGTPQLLAERFPMVKVISLASNEGVAGGYSTGLEYALGYNYEWIWMLDQDSKPLPNTTGRLLVAYKSFFRRDELGLIAPLPVNAATGVPYPLFRWKGRQIAMPTAPAADRLVLVDMVISSGSLVRADALRKAGLPRKDFFMDFVDYEHCLRLRRNGYLIGVVSDCTMPHTIGEPRRVTFLGRSMNWITHPAWRDYYKVRNRTFLVWHELPGFKAKGFVIRKLLAQMLGALLFDQKKLSRINFMWRGLWDGIRGSLGSAIRPND